MSEVSKFRCMVYGCTIPAGIFHEHPSAPLMRDPAEPLNADERAELNKSKAAYIGTQIHSALLHAEALKRFSDEYPNLHVLPADAPIHHGRKLRDALLAAGQYRAAYDASNIQLAMMGEIMNAPLRSLMADIQGMDFGKEPEPIPRRTLAQSVGKFMAWIFSIPALLLAAFAIGEYCGWWV